MTRTQQNKEYIEAERLWLSDYIIYFAEKENSVTVMYKILQDEKKVPEGNYPTFDIQYSYCIRYLERLLTSVQKIETIADIKHFGKYLKQVGILK